MTDGALMSMPLSRGAPNGVRALIEASMLDIPERYRDAGESWVRLDGRARELEARLPLAFARMCRTHTSGSLAAAEREVKASEAYNDLVMEAAQARTEANQARVEMRYWRMAMQRARLQSKATREAE